MSTIRDVLTDAKARIAPVSSSPGLDATLLLAEVLDCSRAHVIAHPEKTLNSEQAERYEHFIARRSTGEPVAYLLGRRAFYDREFIVTPSVLIPRPETEHLLEIAIEAAKTRANPVVVDVGTGSGALAVTLAANVPQAEVCATDISLDALEIAARNAREQDAVVSFFQGDLLQPIIERGIKAEIVMANLPYIATDELATLMVTRHEPRLALDGGADGLELVRRLLVQIPAACADGALILLEIGAEQGAATIELVRTQLKTVKSVDLIRDYAGHDRVVSVRL